ncbi:MAG: hypothetical protein FWC69_00970 [Defluviitaleaceae bacterium]|nr:hypothetical protein [Defluviitaleaceae bacterium]
MSIEVKKPLKDIGIYFLCLLASLIIIISSSLAIESIRHPFSSDDLYQDMLQANTVAYKHTDEVFVYKTRDDGIASFHVFEASSIFPRFRHHRSGEPNALVLSSPGISNDGIWVQGRHEVILSMSCPYEFNEITFFAGSISKNFTFFDNLVYLIFMPSFLFRQNLPDHIPLDFLAIIFLFMPFVVSTALFILHKIIRKKRVAKNEHLS